MLRQNIARITFRRFKHHVLGIDLGTTNSAVAVMGSDQEPQIIENEEGKRTTPSIVAFSKEGETLVGFPAKRQAVVNPENTFFATKRLIGRKFEDAEVQRDLNNVPYKIIPSKQGDAMLSSHKKINSAVVTVPAYFNDSQRQATKNSGKLVGLDVLRVINEPTAAALAYGCDKSREDGIIATLTSQEFTKMVMPIIEKTIDPVKRCVRDAELKFKDIDEVLLVGGMTRMPQIRKMVQDLFGKKPSTAVNPDEAVALGAAIQGAVLSGQVKNVVLLDVTPLSLGIETYGGIFTPLIPRNSAVPIKKEQMFSTAVDGQTGVEIGVYQGERTLVKDNKHIGQFKLSNIPQGPKGTPQIAVSFEIDADGIINVSATDKTPYPKDSEHYGKPNTVAIQVTEVGLTDAEVEKMIQESNRNKKADEEKKRLYEHASRAEILCTDTETALIQFGELMEDEEKKTIKEYANTIKEMIDEIRSGEKLHHPNILNQKVNEMQKTCMEAIQKVALKQQQDKESKN
ncbi:Hsp70 family protein [Candida albicans]|uniref:Hsp70 family protein n=1 Tax=Candida albicans TaxID=5476 RepID=A0A8H6BS37_CANAX|nr:Hsp70 family protein [Candida albicans]